MRTDERPQPRSTGGSLTPEQIERQDFARARKGVDETQVRAFLRRVADEYDTLTRRVAQLEEKLRHPSVPSGQQLVDMVGEEVARTLRSAHLTSEEVTSRARERAAQLEQDAAERAQRLRTEQLEQATQDARAIVEAARERGREMVAEARALRERVMTDLNRRRDTLRNYLEQVRVDRERFIETYRAVREAVSNAHEELTHFESGGPFEPVPIDAGPIPALGPELSVTQAPAAHAGSEREPAAAASGSDARHGPVASDRAPATGIGLGELPGRPEPVPPLAPQSRPPRLKPEPESVPKAEPERAAEPPSEPEPAPAEAEPAPEAEREPAIEPEPAPAPVEPEPVPAPVEPEPALEAEPEPALEAEPEPALEAQPEPALEAEPEPAPAERARELEPELVLESEHEPEPAAMAPTLDLEPQSAPEPQPQPGPGEDVDSLFQRIRAGREQQFASARTDDGPTGSNTSAPAASPTAAEVAPEPDVHDAELLRNRDELLTPVAHDLVRRCKRVLQDEQNEVLDVLRRQRGRLTAERLLPSANEQLARWTEVMTPTIDEAYVAARAATSSSSHESPVFSAPRRLVTGLVEVLVTPLRERLVAAVEGTLADDPHIDADVLAQRIGARYREWKGQELDGRIGDVLAAAYARGVYDATPDGSKLRWVPAEKGQCPDADDNALEPTPRGDRFPTGQQFPPAHPGCRCLLAVVDED
jgi:DivIVA domain-containing protein